MTVSLFRLNTLQIMSQTEEISVTKNERKAINRALRFQELRPDILNINQMRKLNLNQAMKLGGYKDTEEMNSDLDERAKAKGKVLAESKG